MCFLLLSPLTPSLSAAFLRAGRVHVRTEAVPERLTDARLTRDVTVLVVLTGPVLCHLNEKPLALATGQFIVVPAGNRYELQSKRKGTIVLATAAQ